MILSNLFTLLAQATQTSTQPATQPAGGLQDLFKSPLFYFALGLLFLFFLTTKNSKKQRRDREDLLKNLKRGDRIQTIGGMIATVVDVEKDVVTLKIDETSNAKAKFLRSAIHTVITDKKSSDQTK